MNKIKVIGLNLVPIIIMIGLIPIIKNDYWLLAAYAVVIMVSLAIKREPKDFLVLAFGLVALTVSEAFFVSTGVETFTRRTLFNIMPIWLPLLWGYSFIAIKRAVLVL